MGRKCLSHSLHINKVKNQRGYALARRHVEAFSAVQERIDSHEILTVPVVVHVVYRDSADNISDQQIVDQICRLNEDFRANNADLDQVPEPFKALIADTQIEFELASYDPFGQPTQGITRTQTSISEFPAVPTYSDEERVRAIVQELMTAPTGKAGWPADRYMNVWVCNMGMNPLGFASLPSQDMTDDGVVTDVRAFGISPDNHTDFNLGRTLVHEVGHWLNLNHIWGEVGCTYSDNVVDTPVQNQPNYYMPSFPTISCNNAPHGDLFMNFLDYVDDEAMQMFTSGQRARMRAALLGPRRSILSGWGLQVAAVPEPQDCVEANAVLSDQQALLGLLADKGAPNSGYVFDGNDWVALSDAQ